MLGTDHLAVGIPSAVIIVFRAGRAVGMDSLLDN
jgi:hypothetical protein